MKRNKFFLALILLLAALLLPATSLAQKPVECEFEYTVQPGDWLSKLSQIYFGDPQAYTQLVLAANANPDDPYTNIDNADDIEPGWTICIPKNNDFIFRGGTERVAAGKEGKPSGALQSVSQTAQPGFQQFVFTFNGDGMPGFDMFYLNNANINPNTGQSISIQGDVKLLAVFDPGSIDAYKGATRIAADDANVNELVYIGEKDGKMAWAVGMDKMGGYMVTVLRNPSRIVLNIFNPVPGASDLPELLIGSDGPAVEELPRFLVDYGYLTQLPAEAKYNEATRKAVVAYQQDNGLTPDGVVGAQTWAYLLRDKAAQPAPAAPPAAASSASSDNAARTPSGYLTHTPDGKPIVYLTFDDGPSSYTPQIMDVLDKYNAHATFFIIGQQVDSYVDTLRAEATAGHYLASHTWDHPNLTQIDREQFFQQVDATHQAIIDAAGDLFSMDETVAFLRPPYGAMDDLTRSQAAERGYTMVFWDIDTLDWKQPGVDVIVDYVLNEVYPGANVLMHDGGGYREQTIAALEEILPALQAQGYVFYNIWEGKQ